MKDKSYFLRPDLETYKKKFLLLCETCKVEPLITKLNKEIAIRESRIKITENEK